MQNSNEKLRKALEECLEKDLAFIPEDKEIKKIYSPSDKFKEHMRKIIRHEKNKDKFKIIVTSKKKIYYFAAAAAIIFLGLRIGFTSLLPDMESYDMTAPQLESDNSSKSTESATIESLQEESSYDTATAEQSIAEEEADASWMVSVVTDTNVTFKLENTSEEDYTYTDISRIELLEKDSWTTVYTKEKLQEYTISSMSTVEETLQLSDYNMKESGSYRLYRTMNENQITIEINVP